MEPVNVNPQTPVAPDPVVMPPLSAPQEPVVAVPASQPVVSTPIPTTSAVLDLNVEIEALKKKIEGSTMPDGLKEKANGMINRLVKMAQTGGYSQEFEPVSEYINWITQIPFGKYEQEKDLKAVL